MRFGCFLTVLILVCPAFEAWGIGPEHNTLYPETMISFGPSYSRIDNGGSSGSFEMSFTKIIKGPLNVTPSLAVKRFDYNGDIYHGSEFELTTWMLVSFGAGAGFYSGKNKLYSYTFFVGEPLPLFLISDVSFDKEFRWLRGICIEPYLRYSFNNRKNYREFGAYLKYVLEL